LPQQSGISEPQPQPHHCLCRARPGNPEGAAPAAPSLFAKVLRTTEKYPTLSNKNDIFGTALVGSYMNSKGGTMTTAQDINNFLTQKKSRPVCDDCIAKNLELPNRQQSAAVTLALGTTSDFTREVTKCSICGDEKITTQALRI
jgi:hypothetical protein